MKMLPLQCLTSSPPVSYDIFFGSGPFSYCFVSVFSVFAYLSVVVGGPDYDVFLFGLLRDLFCVVPVCFSCFRCVDHAWGMRVDYYQYLSLRFGFYFHCHDSPIAVFNFSYVMVKVFLYCYCHASASFYVLYFLMFW